MAIFWDSWCKGCKKDDEKTGRCTENRFGKNDEKDKKQSRCGGNETHESDRNQVTQEGIILPYMI